MKFDIITIFPKIFDSYFNESILKRAQGKKIIEIKTHNLRDFTTDKHKKVDDRPYGGGAGMVLIAEPIIKAVQFIKSKPKGQSASRRTKIILFSAKGKQFSQKTAYDWSRKFNHFILISGRYEGIDERVRKILKAEEVCIGPYVLTDGDLAAMIIVSALSRLLPGAINWESLAEESFFKNEAKNEAESGKLEYPHYTRPEVLNWQGKKYAVPKVLLSGNHKNIGEWREKQMR